MIKEFLRKYRVFVLVFSLVAVFALTAFFTTSILNHNNAEPENGEAVPVNATVVDSDNTVTRAEWLTMLTDVMEYNKDNDASTYFTDVSAAHPDYDSIQIAVAYDLINTDSETFDPDGKATREFVAVTTAKAVGFFGEPSTIINDISGSPDADNIRLVVDNNIFVCLDGNFNPNGELTVAECNGIISKIKTFITITIDPNHKDVVIPNENLVNLSNTVNPVIYNDSNAMSVILTESDASALTVGTVYVLPPIGDYPYGVARKVTSITQNGDEYIIENEEPAINEVLSSIDIQGEYYPDYANAIWAEGVTVEYIDPVTPTAALWDYEIQPMNYQGGDFPAQPMFSASASEATKITLALNFPPKGDKSDEGNKGNYEVKGSLELFLKATADIEANALAFNIKTADLILEDAYTLSAEITFKGEGKPIPIGKVPIPIVPLDPFLAENEIAPLYIMAEITLTLSGDITVTIKNEALTKSELHVRDNLPQLRGNGTNTLKFEVAANAKAMTKAEFKLKTVGLSWASAYAEIGAAVEAVPTLTCLDVAGYIPFELGAELFPDIEFIEISTKKEIWTKEKNPFPFNMHFEDLKLVEACTKTGTSPPPDIGEPSTPDKADAGADPTVITASHDDVIELTGTITIERWFHEVSGQWYESPILKLDTPIAKFISPDDIMYEEYPNGTFENITEVALLDVLKYNHIEGEHVTVKGHPLIAHTIYHARPLCIIDYDMQTATVANANGATNPDMLLTAQEQTLLDELKAALMSRNDVSTRDIMTSSDFYEIMKRVENEGGLNRDGDREYVVDSEMRFTLTPFNNDDGYRAYLIMEKEDLGHITIMGAYYPQGLHYLRDGSVSFQVDIQETSSDSNMEHMESYVWELPKGGGDWVLKDML